ncbi:MAG: alpha/beta fold hydrolase [Paracoccaceae bacterium]
MRILLCLIFLAACAPDPSRFSGAESPLLYDPAAVARAETIAIFIPGALASNSIFTPADPWQDRGYALVYYRFPGLDGLPFDHALGIEDAAARIAAFASTYPDKRFRLLGYSTGAPIAIRAAEQMQGDVRVAAMSSAVEFGGGLQTTLQASSDLVAAVLTTGSLDRRKIWRAYYRTLLYGRNASDDPDLMASADEIIGDNETGITLPPDGLPRAHTANLRQWTLNRAPRLPAHQLRFFVGLEDSLFSTSQTQAFASNFGDVKIIAYPRNGHLLFETSGRVFDDIFVYFEEDLP